MKYCMFVIILAVLSSCGIYRQNVVNVPLMQHQGQVQLGGHIGFTGYDFQASGALTKHIGLIANYSNTGTNRNVYTPINYDTFKHSFKEAGAGYYTKNPKGLISEYFLIFGKGISSREGAGGVAPDVLPGPYKYSRSANYNRFLFQADFGKSIDKLEYSFSPRIFVLNFYNITDSQNDAYKQLPNTFVWTDYALTMRYMIIKNIKIAGQITFTIPLTGYKAGYYEASPVNGSIGLLVNLNLFGKNP